MRLSALFTRQPSAVLAAVLVGLGLLVLVTLLTGLPARALPPTIDLDTTPADLTVYGDDADDSSGRAVAAGDINGDTTDDLIIGAPVADGSGSGTSCGSGQVGDRCLAGETYVIYGDPPPYIVDSTGDGGDSDFLDGICDDGLGNCTLRAAIEQANADGIDSVINFNIMPVGGLTIAPGSALPTITQPVIIDGGSQPGYAGTPIIVLDGSSATGANGLHITAGASIVRGLVINQFQGKGMWLDGNGGNLIEDNYIGTDVTGTLDRGNFLSGVEITEAPGNFIMINVISGNGGAGVSISGSGATSNHMGGNFIGVDVNGTAGLGNAEGGVFILNAPGNTIGAAEPAERNVISGNGGDGVYISGFDATGNFVQGNFIGTDATGTVDLGNTTAGVFINHAFTNTIGGTAAGARNVISGNNGDGVFIVGGGATGNVVEGNYIGTDVNGTVPLANAVEGVHIFGAPSNTVGGTSEGARNIISGNGWAGVLIYDAGATGNQVQGNYIGTDVNGTADLGNFNTGVYIADAPGNTIGGTEPGARNVISGNDFTGLHINGAGATGNQVQGNFVGTDVTGTADLGNSFQGVLVDSAASNTIGGTEAGARNVISGNDFTGVSISGTGATGNLVQGNYIGTNADGALALANPTGVSISSPGNTIGGTEPGARNVISGNGGDGVYISGFDATGNFVQGNYIGTDATGTVDLGNSGQGVVINEAPSNTVGGTAAEARNIISGNDDSGIHINGAGSTGNFVQGNYIGTDVTATVELGNSFEGVGINNAPGNTIGGTAAGAGNVISGNDGAAVWISNSAVATGNEVLGNYIGTNVEGTAALGNGDGVIIDGAPGNTIGGTEAGAGNVISANGNYGVTMREIGATGNFVQGNYIGTDVTGTVDLGNLNDGVFIYEADSNTIGGTEAGAGNVISGNDDDGVHIWSSGATGNFVQGNFIGTDATGTVDLGNSSSGVDIDEAPGNTIGGTTAEARNVISGNGYEGVSIGGFDATENFVQGNYIGTNADGAAALGNGWAGVHIEYASGNTVGGTAAGAGNVISGNMGPGVYIMDGTGNLVQGNYIGTQADGSSPLGNGSHGVMITTNMTDNGIGGTDSGAPNTIAHNSGDGVFVEWGLGETIRGNSIFSNAGLGIDIAPDGVTPNDPGDGDAGPNNLQNFPELTSAGGGSTTIQGTLNSTPSTEFTLEFFSSSACDPSGNGEGENFLGSTTVLTNGSGDAPFIVGFGETVPLGWFITATATDPLGNTSEFSGCIEVTAAALKIGALLPFTGELEWIGDGLLNAAQLAADDVNAAGGVLGGDVQIVPGDTETEPAAGVTEAVRLIDIEGVNVIVGAASSGVTIPVAEDVTVPGGVLQISPASTSPYISALADDDLLFRTAVSDAFQATVLAELAGELGYETASTMYVNNAYGRGLSDVFVEEFERRGGQVRGAVAHETGQPSYLAELGTATAGNPDVLVAISYPDDASVYLAEAILNGLIDEFLFVDGTRSESMIDTVCTAVGTPGCLDGMYGTAPTSADTPAGLAFDAAYQAAYGEPPVVFARHAYDAVILAAFGAEAAGSSDSSLIRDALRGVSRPGGEVVGLADGGIGYGLTLIRGEDDVDYQGASGCVDLGVYGDVTCGWAEIWRIEGDNIVTDRIEPLEPAPAIVSVDMEPTTPGAQATTDIDLDVISGFSIDIFVQGIPDPGLESFSFDLVYDDSRVDATAVLEGPFLASNGAGTTCSVQNPDVGPGRARLTCSVTGGAAALGDGVLGTIEFDILPIPGGDPLSFVLESTSLTDAVASPISHTTQDGSGDVIGVIETLAGTGEAGYYGDGGPAIEAKLHGPRGVFETGTGSSTYFADTENHRVRKIDAAGTITLVAGNGTGDYCGENGPAIDACLNRPHDVFVDGAGNVYIADTDNDVIRKVDTGDTITKVAGRGGGCVANPAPPHDGCLATEAVLDGPRGVAVDGSGNIYIADTESHRIRRVDGASGVITTVAGNGSPDLGGDGGPAIAAGLNRPHDVYVYGELGDFVIADTLNNRIRRVDGYSGVIDTFAGSGQAADGGDGGLATLAHLNGPEAVAVDSANSRLPNVFIADTQNHRIRRVDGRSTIITTVAGDGTVGSGGDGGPATEAQLNLPSGVTPDPLIVSDTNGNVLRTVDPTTGKPSGRFSGFSCTVGSISTADWVLVAFVLGLVLARRRIRGLMMQIRVLARLAARPGTPG